MPGDANPARRAALLTESPLAQFWTKSFCFSVRGLSGETVAALALVEVLGYERACARAGAVFAPRLVLARVTGSGVVLTFFFPKSANCS